MKDLLQKSANKSETSQYDCVIPIIGDAEDYFLVAKVLEAGLTPLVVFINDYYRNDIGWSNIHNLVLKFDLDSIFFHPHLKTYKELVKTSFRKYLDVLLPFNLLWKNFPKYIALQRKIPLVIYGARSKFYNKGAFAEESIYSLIGNGAQVKEEELFHYGYRDSRSFLNIKEVYLSDYLDWDAEVQNTLALQQGFSCQLQGLTFDYFQQAGSSVYYNLHNLLQYKKSGRYLVEVQVEREMLHGRLKELEGSQVINFYKKKKIYIKHFFNWLGVTESGYQWVKKHHLNSLNDFICDEEDKDADIELPHFISKTLCDARVKKEDFILFGL